MSGWDRLTASSEPAEPMTREQFLARCQRVLDKVREQGYWPQPRIVSYKVYQEAEHALEGGATREELEWVLGGASWASVKAMRQQL